METAANEILGYLLENTDFNGVRDAPARVPFGLPALDLITGGIPLGRVSVLWGRESSGKTTTALHLAKTFTQPGGIERAVYWLDAEVTYDRLHAGHIGVNHDLMFTHVRAPRQSAEDLLLQVSKVANAKRANGEPMFGMIVIDSMNAMPTIRTIEGEMEDKDMGSSAKLWGRFLSGIVPALEEHQIALVLIAQMRTQIGGYLSGADLLSGGNAIRHYASLILKFRPSGGKKAKDPDTKEEVVVATHLKPMVHKTKISGATIGATAEMELRRDGAIAYFDPVPQLRDAGAALGLLHNKDGKPAGGSGKWYFTDPATGEVIELTVGREKVAEMLRTRPDVLAILYDAVYDEINRRIHANTPIPVEIDDLDEDTDEE